MYFFSKYFIYSKNFYVSLLFLLPMLFLYELLCFLHYFHEDYQLRNSADVFIKNIFNNINPSINIFLTFILITLFLWLIYHNYKISFQNGINLSYLFLMILESIFWSFTLIILIKKLFSVKPFIPWCSKARGCACGALRIGDPGFYAVAA